MPLIEEDTKCFRLKNKKPISPSAEEIILNPPSRSAKLRFAIKINNQCNFDKFLRKFKQLLEIENLQFNK